MEEKHLPDIGGSLMSSKVSTLLLREMKSGAYASARKLPPEAELAERLGVSRSVIRDALSDLEHEGYVERIRGVGTVIDRNIVNLTNRLDMKLEYNDLIRNAGCTPTSDSFLVRRKKADVPLAEKLGIPPGTEIIAFEKRVLAGKRPVIYSFDYLRASLLRGTDWRTIDWRRTIFDVLEDVCGAAVTTDLTQVCATNADPYVRKKLELKPEEALILLDEISCDRQNRPVLRSFEFYTDFFDFFILRKRF